VSPGFRGFMVPAAGRQRMWPPGTAVGRVLGWNQPCCDDGRKQPRNRNHARKLAICWRTRALELAGSAKGPFKVVSEGRDIGDKTSRIEVGSSGQGQAFGTAGVPDMRNDLLWAIGSADLSPRVQSGLDGLSAPSTYGGFGRLVVARGCQLLL
jgi:hypothetical protein